MKLLLVLLPFLVATAAVPGQIDEACLTDCSVLAVQHGDVMFLQPSREVALGRYQRRAQSLVPTTEAPIRDLHSPVGWRIVVSAFLDHGEVAARLRLRLIDRHGVLRLTEEVFSVLEYDKIGHLFGGSDDLLAITSSEEHAYNAQSIIWFLPKDGPPIEVLSIVGIIRAFFVPGVAVGRQTYDGVNSETKGTVPETYLWDTKTKSLVLKPR